MPHIYTKTGDRGQTSLADGSRVSKSLQRIGLYGDVDELNSALGVAVALLRQDPNLLNSFTLDGPAVLEEIQSRLFDLGAVLANPQQSATEVSFPTLRLEELIDTLEEELPPLKNFILPGGHLAGAQLHVARAISRRVERLAVTLAESEPVPASAVAWLNRLSDFLFVAARLVNQSAGRRDILWQPASAATNDTE